MTKLIIDKKKYVLMEEREYNALQKRAAIKSKPEKIFKLEDARDFSKKLIRKWAADQSL